MKRFFLIATVVAISFVACDKNEVSQQAAVRTKAPSNSAEYDADFERVAFAVNRLLEDAEFRDIVHKEVDECFDGDFNVLISQLIVKNRQTAEWFNMYDVDILGIVEKYPLIQIAIPVLYEKWDGTEGLPVVFMEYGFNEGESLVIRGYGEKGEPIELDAVKEPDFPVVVIGENERTKVLDELPTEPATPQNLTVTEDKEGIRLEWEQYSNEEEVGYDIYRKGNDDKEFVQIASLTSEKSERNNYSFVDVNATVGRYEYYVVATGNHTTGGFIVIREDIFKLVENPKILYSGQSDVVAGGIDDDELDPRLSIKLEIFYDVSNSLKLKWNSVPIGSAVYKVYRRLSSISSSFLLIGTTTSNYFIDNNSLNQNHLYKYQVRVSSPYIASNYAYSHVSHRKNNQKMQIKECRFVSEKDLLNLECWTRGAPEMKARCCISNKNNVLVKNHLIEFEPKHRKDIYSKWFPVNQDFLDRDEVNTLGSMVSFVWWEEDGGGKRDRPFSATTGYEDHYNTFDISSYSYEEVSTRFQTPIMEITKIYRDDDILINSEMLVSYYGRLDNFSYRTFEWWEGANSEINQVYKSSANGLFEWKIKTVN